MIETATSILTSSPVCHAMGATLLSEGAQTALTAKLGKDEYYISPYVSVPVSMLTSYLLDNSPWMIVATAVTTLAFELLPSAIYLPENCLAKGLIQGSLKVYNSFTKTAPQPKPALQAVSADTKLLQTIAKMQAEIDELRRKVQELAPLKEQAKELEEVSKSNEKAIDDLLESCNANLSDIQTLQKEVEAIRTEVRQEPVTRKSKRLKKAPVVVA